MNLIHKFLDRTEYADYEDFSKNAKLKIPEKFNFAYDVIDEYARLAPDKRAILWCNDKKKRSRSENLRFCPTRRQTFLPNTV